MCLFLFHLRFEYGHALLILFGCPVEKIAEKKQVIFDGVAPVFVSVTSGPDDEFMRNVAIEQRFMETHGYVVEIVLGTSVDEYGQLSGL